MPEIMSLKKNYRTHQGILDSAALVVDMIKKLFPLSIDDLERESALFDGPPPLLLSSSTAGDIKSIYNDLLILIAGSDRSSSSVEFGAHQVIIVRSIEAKKKLPKEFDNAIVLTVPQAKGLEFDDVFLVDFFGDSDATDEWRCLSYLLENLKSACLDDSSKSLSLPPGIYKAIEITLSAREEGYVRPLEFERDKHSLLQEELKHLYTAITR